MAQSRSRSGRAAADQQQLRVERGLITTVLRGGGGFDKESHWQKLE